jgi:two-component system, cell cycle sensor histidine kinase and response regulator CckA
MKKTTTPDSRILAFKIVGIYLTVGIFWILVSDTLLEWLNITSANNNKVQLAKGCIFVLVTGWMLYLLVRRGVEEQNKSQESISRLAGIVESSADAVISKSLEGAVTSWNKSAERIFGYGADEIVGQSIDRLFPPEKSAEIKQILDSIKQGQSLEQFETRCLNKEGNAIDVSFTLSPIRDAEEKIIGVSIIGRDETISKRMEEALKQSEQDYHGLFDNAHDALLILDPETETVLDVNNQACAIYGFSKSEFVGLSVASITKDLTRDQQAIQYRAEKGGFQNVETVQRRKDGSEIHLEINTALVNYKGRKALLSINRDITERKLLEDQFRQSQKMEAVGRLAGGIAHDFNNLLTAIIGYSQLALRGLKSDNPLRNHFEEIEKAGKRAAGLTGKMLAFSRKQVIQPKLINLNNAIVDMEKMVGRLIGEDIEIATFLQSNLWQVRADLGQIEQVLMNLVVNARDAMPKGGKLTLDTGNVRLDEVYARHHIDVEPGDYVMLAVSDTGTGMNAKTMSHLFEPFFTTKEVGKGTGLGLSTVYGIVKQNGGHIWVYSEPGIGTTFKVYLPRVKDETDVDEQIEVPLVQTPGNETILIVEDEEAVRYLVRQILHSKGYKVLEASNGVDALLLLEQLAEPPQLIITDVIMPFMSGREFADKAVTVHENMKVLFMSGYTDDAIVQHGILDSNVAFIQKPFTTVSLANKVREVLDGHPVSAK